MGCQNQDLLDFRIFRIIGGNPIRAICLYFCLNARRIWASTPQIADCHGLRGLRGFLVVFSVARSLAPEGRHVCRKDVVPKKIAPAGCQMYIMFPCMSHQICYNFKK